MRLKRLVASLAVVIFGVAAAPVRAADNDTSQPSAAAPAATPDAPKPEVQDATPGSAPASTPTPTPANPQPNPVPAAKEEPAPPPSVTILGAKEAHGVLGRDVRSAANEDMGHIVDVIVDRTGTVRAAVIDFGGFLGVGSRKIVVDWNALRFGRVADKSDAVTLELTKDQVKTAPEYKEDQPIVVLGASGILKPLEFEDQ